MIKEAIKPVPERDTRRRITIDGVTYTEAPEIDDEDPCQGCAGAGDVTLCWKLHRCGHNIWVRDNNA
jgi:hypothetical protein